jgi:hypothetical protein
MTEDAVSLRKKLIENKIYVPILWPNINDQMNDTSTDHWIANHILPLPCDQRYGEQEMETICGYILAEEGRTDGVW